MLSLKGHTDNITCITYSPDGKILASSSWDKTIKLWDFLNGIELNTLKGHQDKINKLQFSPNNR